MGVGEIGEVKLSGKKKQQVIDSPETYGVKGTNCPWTEKYPSCDEVFSRYCLAGEYGYFMESHPYSPVPFF